MHGFWQRGAGFVAGLFLVFVGMAMLMPGEGMPATGPFVAMASVLTALGIGIVAAAALPHELKVGGEDFKPFGLSVSASGGAAVFIVALGFLFYWEPGSQIDRGNLASANEVGTHETGTDGPAEPKADEDEPAQPNNPTDQPAATPDPEPTVPPPPPPTRSPEEAFVGLEEGEDYGNSYDYIANAQNQTGLYRYMTYCPLQCPAGPDLCPSLAWGQHAQRIPAQQIAVSYCVGAGGDEACCANNLVEF